LTDAGPELAADDDEDVIDTDDVFGSEQPLGTD